MKFKQAVTFASAVTGFNAIVLAGFSLAAVFNPASVLPAGAATGYGGFILALYLAAHYLVFALFVFFVIWKKYTRMLVVLGIFAAAIQFADMWIGIYQLSAVKALAGLALGALQSYATWMLHKARRTLPVNATARRQDLK